MNFKVIESNTSFEGYILDIRKDKIEFEGIDEIDEMIAAISATKKRPLMPVGIKFLINHG